MFLTAIRQLRFAYAQLSGRPPSSSVIRHLVADALRTLDELGEPDAEAARMLTGPALTNPAERLFFQERAVRRTARFLARSTPFYRDLFSACGLLAHEITPQTIARVPLTNRRHLRTQPRAFLSTPTRPLLSTCSTGTTGAPVEIWLSAYEVELWPALMALGMLLRGEIDPRNDRFQVNAYLRATATMQLSITLCHLLGIPVRAQGIVPPDLSLDALLGEDAATILQTYPSYLALLLQAARRRGLRAADFRLKRILCGGEILSPALAHASAEMFGVAHIQESYAMTEILPVTGQVCSQGHLHFDPQLSLVEVLELDGEGSATATPAQAEPGKLGRLVVSPYAPYRMCMPVFRLDTGDLVRRLPDEPLHCELAALPATSPIQGKVVHLLHVSPSLSVTPRALMEAVEDLPIHPWPARFKSLVTARGIELAVPQQSLGDLTESEALRYFQDKGLPICTVRRVVSEEAGQLRPVRADMLEASFAVERG